MRRKLLTLAAGVSAVVCAGVCVLWVRSYWTQDALTVSHGWSFADFASLEGEIGCEFGRWSDRGSRDVYAAGPEIRYEVMPAREVRARTFLHIVQAGGRDGPIGSHDVWGFRWHPRLEWAWKRTERGIALPAWSLVLLLGVLPAWRCTTVLRSYRRSRPGVCSRCGYDLRATPDRCPECGAVPAAKGERA